MALTWPGTERRDASRQVIFDGHRDLYACLARDWDSNPDAGLLGPCPTIRPPHTKYWSLRQRFLPFSLFHQRVENEDPRLLSRAFAVPGCLRSLRCR